MSSHEGDTNTNTESDSDIQLNLKKDDDTQINPKKEGDTRRPPSESGGTSYARAVSKVNVKETEKEGNAMKQTKGEPAEVPADDDSFTPVVSHSRKERRQERSKREKPRESKPLPNGTADKRDPPATAKAQPHEQSEEAKKVFVEAPLPKVNPWQANRNAAQVIANKDAEKPVSQQQPAVNGASQRKEERKVR